MTMKIADVLDRFVAGFNENDLNDVMSYFAEDAVYRPGDGSEHRGKAAIRRAFEPQFEGAYGAMQFLVDDRVVDENTRKAAIRWVCKHDFTEVRSPLARWFFTTVFGRRSGWYGTDIFHFDEQGKIVGKFSYANYPWPRLQRDLG